MAVTFAVRGDSLNARYAPGGATPGNLNGVTQVNAAGTGIIGAGYIEMSSTLASRGLYWPALNNFPTGNQFSFLIRCAIIGSTTSANGLLALGFPQQVGTAGLIFQSAALYQFAQSMTAVADIGLNNGAWTPTLGTYYDIVGVFDMTTNAANSLLLYIDGVQLATNNNTSNWGAGPRTTRGWQICLGMNDYGGTTRIRVNEAVIFDTLINPTAGGLNLNGASRSSFIACSAFDGGINVSAGAANIRLGDTTEVIAGITTTGTMAVPSAANVRSGTAVDAGTGTLIVPSAANVRSGTSVDAGTGTLIVPSLANTKIGVSGDGGTGTYDGSDRNTDVGIANVRLGSIYKSNSLTDNRVGTLDLPPTGAVLAGTVFDNASQTGTFTTPSAADVASAVWDSLKADHTIDGSFGASSPSVDEIVAGVMVDGSAGTGVIVSPTDALVLGSNLITWNVDETVSGSFTYDIISATELNIIMPATADAANGDHIIFKTTNPTDGQWYYIIIAIDGVELPITGGWAAGPDSRYVWIYVPIATGASAEDNAAALLTALNGSTEWGSNGMSAASDSSGPGVPTIVADAVWNSTMSGFTNTSKFGGFVQKLLTFAKFLGINSN